MNHLEEGNVNGASVGISLEGEVVSFSPPRWFSREELADSGYTEAMIGLTATNLDGKVRDYLYLESYKVSEPEKLTQLIAGSKALLDIDVTVGPDIHDDSLIPGSEAPIIILPASESVGAYVERKRRKTFRPVAAKQNIKTRKSIRKGEPEVTEDVRTFERALFISAMDPREYGPYLKRARILVNSHLPSPQRS